MAQFQTLCNRNLLRFYRFKIGTISKSKPFKQLQFLSFVMLTRMQAMTILDHTRKLPKQMTQAVRVRMGKKQVTALDKIIAMQKPDTVVAEPARPSRAKQLSREKSSPQSGRTKATSSKATPKPTKQIQRANSSPPSIRTQRILQYFEDSEAEDVFGDDFDEFWDVNTESQEGQLNTFRSAIRKHGKTVPSPCCGHPKRVAKKTSEASPSKVERSESPKRRAKRVRRKHFQDFKTSKWNVQKAYMSNLSNF